MERMTSCYALPVDDDLDEESHMFSSLTDGYAEPDAHRVSALRAAAVPEVAAAVSSATVVGAGPGEL